MKEMKERVLRGLVRTAERIVGADGNGRPPCIGYIYQPKRPEKLELPKK